MSLTSPLCAPTSPPLPRASLTPFAHHAHHTLSSSASHRVRRWHFFRLLCCADTENRKHLLLVVPESRLVDPSTAELHPWLPESFTAAVEDIHRCRGGGRWATGEHVHGGRVLRWREGGGAGWPNRRWRARRRSPPAIVPLLPTGEGGAPRSCFGEGAIAEEGGPPAGPSRSCSDEGGGEGGARR
jgi:hypothetical protein